MPDLPHVTAILAAAGLVPDNEWFRDYDLARGTAVHLATQFLDEGDLYWPSVDPLILGRVCAYQRFLEEARPEILAIEERVVNEPMRYQGKLDRRLVIRGREGVLDIKGPSRAPWHPIQLAMYAAPFLRPMARWNLYLADDGYRLVERKDATDWQVAKAAISIAAWKERNNGHSG